MLLSVICILGLVQLISASAFTFVLGANEKSCFYVFTEHPKVPIRYYFAVQSGGSFDVDYVITDPNGNKVIEDTKQRQGDFVFTADHVGEYEFCFLNTMSTFAEKIVDFEIKFENEADSGNGDRFRANLPDLPKGSGSAHVENMKNTVDKIEEQLDGLYKTLQYYKTRNNRNQATVQSTESRIYYFSIFEVLLMVGMAFLQITIVQLFFRGSRKQLV
ncbi:putative membrane protein C17A5.08 [Candida viswanathii]|uniref:Putative membrane protein C17A5.08 n=1 Tax=Candida viswanathii TaxID=5486 RepID=A0A367XP83_9ASCO|nr:putative membrane protein C17A5.08 [Candida viswanathii]